MKKEVQPKNDNGENRDMIEAVAMLAKEKNISKEILFTAIEEALRSAYKNNFSKQYGVPQSSGTVRVELDRVTGTVHLYARKTVVRWVIDEPAEMSVEEAKAIQPSYEEGDIIEIEVTPKNFRRMAAQTAKQVIVQKIREAERGKSLETLSEKEGEILTAIVHSIDPDTHAVITEVGKSEGIIEQSQQMATDTYAQGERIKVYVLDLSVDKNARSTATTATMNLSRIHQNLVKRLFEMEVPEIQSGIVQIKSIAREAGSRTKMAVFSTDALIDPVGSCVGPHGQRVDRVVTELRGEKIDIIKWSADPEEFVANALNPAHVISVFVSQNEKACRVVVPDNQLSLAIGKEGQNARLAAKLTGWKIDIKSQSQVEDQMLETPATQDEEI